MKKEKLKKLPHFISGGMILLHSVERFEMNHNSYLIFLFAGIVFMSVAVLHKKISKKFPLVDITFYALEGILSFVIAFEYWEAGKTGLPIPYIIAGLFQMFAIYKFALRAKKSVI
ncbi:hypothetical protein [Flavobacterium pallidum]|nr:hypothetical protein [Flavobacterium pallidum]